MATVEDVVRYNLLECCVSGKSLMGVDPEVRVYGQQEVKFCSSECVVQFESNKEQYLSGVFHQEVATTLKASTDLIAILSEELEGTTRSLAWAQTNMSNLSRELASAKLAVANAQSRLVGRRRP